MAPPPRRRPGGPYHHGDLRQALVGEATRIVEERGAAALTLREAARRAGVSHAAPAHHFGDLDGLRAAVAAAGHDALRAALLAGASGARDGAARLRGAGAAYVQFAARHTALFALMFQPVGERRAPEQERAATAAFEVLLGAVRAAQADAVVGPGPPREAALAAWAAVHGLAVLVSAGLAARKGFELPPRRLAERVGQLLLDGLRAR